MRASARASIVIAILASGCHPSPLEVTSEALAAFRRGDWGALERSIDPGYADTLGDRARLLADLERLERGYARPLLTASETSVVVEDSRLAARVVGRLDVELVGAATWRFTGPLELELRRDGGFRILSGVLTDLRDILGLMEHRRAALEANDVEAYATLLHPTYRDGGEDRDAAVQRLGRDLEAVRIRLSPSLYRIEVRGPLAHVDEHYILTLGERALPAAVARFTLKRSAGLWLISAGLYPGTLGEPEAP